MGILFMDKLFVSGEFEYVTGCYHSPQLFVKRKSYINTLSHQAALAAVTFKHIYFPVQVNG